jgi:hypothetical protein
MYCSCRLVHLRLHSCCADCMHDRCAHGYDAQHYTTLHTCVAVLQCAQEVADTLRQTHPSKLQGQLLKHAQFVFSTLSSSSRLSQRSYVFTVEHLIIADGTYISITSLYSSTITQRSVHVAAYSLIIHCHSQ